MLTLGMSVILSAAAGASVDATTLNEEQALAQRFQSDVHIPALPFQPEPVTVHLNTTPMISYTDDSGVHEAIFDELPPPVQGIFNQWAGFTSDQPSGQALFNDMFHKFFFIHELGHWTTGQVLEVRQDAKKQTAIANVQNNHWETELETNRIAVAWWRAHDPAFLAKIVGDFRKIQAALPNPVQPGTDMKAYFAANYEKLGQDPNAYGWFLLQSVILAYDEPPKTFQQTLDTLATYDFN